ncbi:hypothetical protein [Streptomyces sp. NPDC058451]|uniref:hypothetical protein n=1 Tax=Streptomyces sp. NPDC058451 TaxID=3346506 RepID=UPI003654414E
MNRGDQLPADWAPNDDPTSLAAMHVAMQWKELDPAHLAAAMAAMEPSLRREHRERLTRMQMQREAAQQDLEERQRARTDRRRMVEVVCGTVVALAMLGGGIYAAPHSWWLSTLLCGPSLLALTKVFVLGRSDPDDMKLLSAAARVSTDSAGRAQASQQPPEA